MKQPSRFVVTAIVTVVTLSILGGCSGADESASNPEVIDLREDETGSGDGEVETVDVDDVDEGEIDEAASEEPVEIIDEPAVRLEENPSIDASNWLARTFMDANSVELVWSPVEGADNYRLYRLPTAEADYDAIATGVIEGAVEIYDGLDEFTGFVDDDVPSDTFLTYVIVAEVDGETTEPRWTEALTVDDVTPPEPITELTATDTDEGVLLEWQPSRDDVEFASYSVTILEDDGRFRYIGGGADLGQVSFLDNEEFTGTRTYVVAAVDFHDNVSETAQVEVSR